MQWKITLTDDSSATALAGEEFARLMEAMDPAGEGSISIGLSDKAPAVEDSRYDDGIAMDVKNGKGFITGSNPRSVLMGVYRFFREAGCAFVRPGRDGEYIPRVDSAALSVSLSETPFYRHRGICIEGANSFENIANMVAYLPKVGYNTYFTQFFRPFEFFDRWYSHRSNPQMEPTPVSTEVVDAFQKDYSAMLTRRGLMHHGVGHGWTAACLGLDANGWYTVPNSTLTPEKKALIAEIQGERRLFSGKTGDTEGGVAINTNLCYSDPTASEAMVEQIASYCLAHPDLDYVHIWLADGTNNQCECEACKATTPSDQYVAMLNRVDERLKAAGCDTKLVFLLYHELLWPPVKERFTHPERFTLMFAPISRTYTHSYEVNAAGSIAPFTRNAVKLPRSVGDSLAYLKGWQTSFSGDDFVYDYHYVWDQYFDMGGMNLARVLAEDIAQLKNMGLNGMMSCQITRCHMPTALGQVVMADTLWKGRIDFDAEAKRYYEQAFGQDGWLALQYCLELSRLCQSPYCRNEKPPVDAEAAALFAKIPELIENFLPVMERNSHLDNPVHARSWFYLLQQAQWLPQLAGLLQCRASADREGMLAHWEELKRIVCHLEPLVQPVFETTMSLGTWSRLIREPKPFIE